MYTTIEAELSELPSLLWTGHNNPEIAKQLKVSGMTVHICRLRNGEGLKHQPRSGRRLVVKESTFKKAFDAQNYRACEKKKNLFGYSVQAREEWRRKIHEAREMTPDRMKINVVRAVGVFLTVWKAMEIS